MVSSLVLIWITLTFVSISRPCALQADYSNDVVSHPLPAFLGKKIQCVKNSAASFETSLLGSTYSRIPPPHTHPSPTPLEEYSPQMTTRVCAILRVWFSGRFRLKWGVHFSNQPQMGVSFSQRVDCITLNHHLIFFGVFSLKRLLRKGYALG